MITAQELRADAREACSWDCGAGGAPMACTCGAVKRNDRLNRAADALDAKDRIITEARSDASELAHYLAAVLGPYPDPAHARIAALVNRVLDQG